MQDERLNAIKTSVIMQTGTWHSVWPNYLNLSLFHGKKDKQLPKIL